LSTAVVADASKRHMDGLQLPAKLNKFNAVLDLYKKFTLFASDDVEIVIGSAGQSEAGRIGQERNFDEHTAGSREPKASGGWHSQ
jgi:hypothetical protein